MYSRKAIFFCMFCTAIAAGQGSHDGFLLRTNRSGQMISLFIKFGNGEGYARCENLTVNLLEYNWWKWKFLAPISGALGPKKKMDLDEIDRILALRIGKGLVIEAHSPLKKIANCHFESDGLELIDGVLILYYDLHRI